MLSGHLEAGHCSKEGRESNVRTRQERRQGGIEVR